MSLGRGGAAGLGRRGEADKGQSQHSRKDSGCQPGFKLGDSVAEGSKSRKHWAGALWEEDEE